MTKTLVEVPASQSMVALLGVADEYLQLIEGAFPEVDILVRGNQITLEGEDKSVDTIDTLVTEMLAMIRTGQGLNADSVQRSISLMKSGTRPSELMTANILSSRGKTIRPKTLNQKKYVEAIDKIRLFLELARRDRKTYLAVAKHPACKQSSDPNRVTRPAVEAGEKLGFLPGTLSEKIDPYLRPLYDALHDMIDPDSIPRLITSGTIEIAPLAYMRGRTLNDAFIILDEAQNTSAAQMKMFLTRLGFGSTMVVTGDVTQVDLPSGTMSGLRLVSEILNNVGDVEFCRLTASDVVRHRLVGEIVSAYDQYDQVQQSKASGARSTS